MKKSELVERLVSKNPSFTIPEVDMAVRVILDGIGDALAQGQRVEIRGFGSFSVRHLKSRQGRNPRTGEAISVEDKHKLHFKPGKELRDRVNHSLLLELD